MLTRKILFMIGIFLSSTSFADEIVITNYGRKVTLKPDGTWQYIHKLNTEIVITENGREIELYPDGKWQYRKESPPAKTNKMAVLNDHTAIGTVRAYWNAKNWRERLPLVLESESVASIMESRYGNIEWGPLEFKILNEQDPDPGSSGWYKITVEQVYKNNKGEKTRDHHYYYLKKINDVFRINWLGSVGYNSISVNEFHATKSTSPIIYNVTAVLSDYFNYEFRGKGNEFYSVDLSDSRGKNLGHGYVRIKTKTGKNLFNLIRDGNFHTATLELKYLPLSRTSSNFLISKIINIGSWCCNQYE